MLLCAADNMGVQNRMATVKDENESMYAAVFVVISTHALL